MAFGLEQKIIDSFISVFEQNSKVDKAIMFGSRAKGNYRPDSDIDIAIKGQDITTNDIIKMSIAFEEKGIAYKVDLINYNSIKEPLLTEHIDRVGIEFYSRWRKHRIGDLLHLEYGKSLTDYRNGIGKYEVFGTNGKIGNSDKYLYDEPSIIIGRKGAYRETHFAKHPFFVIDTAFYTKQKTDDTNIVYMYYWFKNTDINAMDSGSAIPSTSRDEVYDLEINLPPLSEQKSIAETLRCLDDKIDLLSRQNKTLEELAETLFRKKLIENNTEWELKSFGEFIESTLGGEWGKEKPEGDFTFQVCCIRGTDIADLQTGLAVRTPIRFVKEKKFESIQPLDGDLVLEISGGTDDQSTGRTIYINDLNRTLFPHPLVFSNFCRLIRPKKKEYSYFLYLYLQYLYHQDEFFNLENGTSGIKNLDYKYLLFELNFSLPKNEKELIALNKEVEIYFEKINKNKHQILNLIRLRDTLLPKLMSGEVRIVNN